MTTLFRLLSVLTLCAVIVAPRPVFGQVSADDAKPFLGDWTLKYQGQSGPVDIKLKIAVDGAKVVGDLTSPTLGAAKSTQVVKAADGLTLKFDVKVQDMAMTVAITLTPDGAKFKTVLEAMDGQVKLPGEVSKL
jgi:hypothetical protein